IPPAGLFPGSIVEAPGNEEYRWRLVPVCPGAMKAASSVAEGRYTAPELASCDNVDDLHADVYGASWIVVELIAGRMDLPRDSKAAREAIPYKRFATLIENGLIVQGAGYMEPKLLRKATDR